MESSWISIIIPLVQLNASMSQTSLATVIVWVFCLIIFGCSLRGFVPKLRKLRLGLKEFASNVEALVARQIDFDTLSHRLNSQDNPVVARAWNDYDSTLLKVPEGEKGIRVYSTISARFIFNSDDLFLENSGLHSVAPALLTGLGILGTFLGLSLGLTNVNLASEDLVTLKQGIRSLLAGAHTAFVTSVWGIGLSITLTWLKKIYFNQISVLLDRICDWLDQSFPRRLAEAWLSEVYREAREQTAELKKFNDELAWSIAAALDEKLAARITPALENLLGAIEKLTETGSAEVARVISREAGAEVVKLGEILQQASDVLSNTLHASSELQRNIGETVSRQLALTASHVEESLGNSVVRFGELTHQVERAVEQVRQSIAEQILQQKQYFEESMNRLQETTKSYLEDFLVKVDHAVGHVSERSSNVVSEVGHEIGRLLEELSVHVKELGDEYTARRNDLRAAVDEITTLLAMIEKLVGEASRVLDAYRESAQPVREAGVILAKSVETFTEAGTTLRQATQEFSGLWDEYRRHSAQVVSEIRQALQHTESAWRAYESRLGQIRQELESVFGVIEDGLRRYAETVHEGMSRYLKELDGEMGKAIGSLGAAVGELGETLADFLEQLHERR
ncbi:anti-phage ZorAB system protein ZorA [Desulfofundulus salinus]|uniref:MotA/TolQ/ExbB proton channel domain-containing protein n=1 Tax=Desulfofundulus salinus TaxID=2419843 RepID=A0A494WTD8_9FIRM|nr:anti-phage ZorAB system protein ZorA [Desulfofundulus salinum]RKO66649.1 hypothetical protein D7024_06620 [Desulfofundulus salinum]